VSLSRSIAEAHCDYLQISSQLHELCSGVLQDSIEGSKVCEKQSWPVTRFSQQKTNGIEEHTTPVRLADQRIGIQTHDYCN